MNILEFKCTNIKHQPVMQALEIIKDNLNNKGAAYPEGIMVPLKGVVSSDWMPLVVEDDDGGAYKVNRIAYEICALKAVRERLRCREIWVVGSRRYRDPEEDLPQNFEERKSAYYEDLGVPLDPKIFMSALRKEIVNYLNMINKHIQNNPKVRIVHKKKRLSIFDIPF